MRKHNLCVIVPAYNEEKVIEASLIALKAVIGKDHIYVVSDGSRDKTAELARKYVPSVLALRNNRGKATALDLLIKKFKLTERYNYIMFSDADSRLSPDFRDQIEQYMLDKPACIVGTVLSDRKGFISAYRTFEYSLSHKLYKNAQNIMRIIAVAPGCASIYRSDILNQLDLSNHTLTEDFDFTIQIHLKKLGSILYAPKAYVVTQDPPTLRDYWRQIMRWYTGTWQNIFIHQLYKPTTAISLELYLLLLDNIAAMSFLLYALIFPNHLGNFLLATYISLLSVGVFFVLLTKEWWALLYSPIFPAVYLINLIASPISLIRAIVGRNRRLSWHKVARYAV
jgi:biofilm PGA synthesis N-glycosyltransferase PgaC